MQNPKNLNSAVHLRSVATTRRVAVSHREVAFWNTMIGKKVVMAITGIALVGFVIGHMLGNLKIFAGPETINAYSRFLREVGMPELELRPAPLARADLPSYLRSASHHRGGPAYSHEPGCATHRLRHQTRYRDDLGARERCAGAEFSWSPSLFSIFST